MTQKIIFAFLLVILVVATFDWIVYALKRGAKRSTLTKNQWRFGFICGVALVYWYINGCKFW